MTDFNERRACCCIGPQNGEPLCPCMMRGVFQRNGRWIKPEEDLGPVRSHWKSIGSLADDLVRKHGEKPE